MMAGLSLAHAGLSVLAGTLTTLSPCVFPLLPIVLGGMLQAGRAAPLAMGLGMAVSFALLGAAIGSLGQATGINGDAVRMAGGALLVALGIVMLMPALNRRFAAFATPLATAAGRASNRIDGASLRGAFGLGAVLGIVWSPCSGPLLAAAVTLVATEGGALRGAAVLGLFGLGAALPLVAAAYASRAGFARARNRVLAHAETAKKVFGIVLALTGALILSGGDKAIETFIVERMPDAWLALTVKF